MIAYFGGINFGIFEHWTLNWMSYAFVIYFTLHTLQFTQFIGTIIGNMFAWSAWGVLDPTAYIYKLKTSFIIIHKSNECKTWSQKCVEVGLLFIFIYFFAGENQFNRKDSISIFKMKSMCPMADVRWSDGPNE